MAAGRAISDLRRARSAVTAVFFLNGTLLATYIVRIPSLKVDPHLGDGELAVVLTLFGVAALFTMQFAGQLVARLGSARVIRLTLVGGRSGSPGWAWPAAASSSVWRWCWRARCTAPWTSP